MGVQRPPGRMSFTNSTEKIARPKCVTDPDRNNPYLCQPVEQAKPRLSRRCMCECIYAIDAMSCAGGPVEKTKSSG